LAQSVWPQPQKDKYSGEKFLLTDKASFTFVSTGHSSSLLDKAYKRYIALIYYAGPDPNSNGKFTGIDVNVQSSDESLHLDTDESYTLVIGATRATITAKTVYGAMHALETFSQLVSHDNEGHKVYQAEIEDFPRFRHRGFLIDTARHFLSMNVMKQQIDALAYTKMNVLHWHLSDEYSYSTISTTVPEMRKAAFDDNHLYSVADVAELVQYGLERGVRIIPEVDTPGHTKSWKKAVPEIMVDCPYDYSVLNPALNSTYEMLGKLWQGLSTQYPDEYVHTGGDELDLRCWKNHQSIDDFMRDHKITSLVGLETYFERRLLLQVLKPMKKAYVVWQEVFDNGVDLPLDTVVHVWKDQQWQTDLASVVKAGHKALLSSPWYLNYIAYKEPWQKYYEVEPLDIAATDEEKKRVMGGEGCMWGEFVDNTNSLSRVWPRAGAVAERLWSSKDVRDYALAVPRLTLLGCRLIRRDIPANPIHPGFCAEEYNVRYTPPWEK